MTCARWLLVALLPGGCVPWQWPGDVSGARELAGRAEIQRVDPLVVRVDRDLGLRFRPEADHHPDDGPARLVAKPCGGPIEGGSGSALSLWLPDGACVAQLDQRPGGGRWTTVRDVFPMTRVYADPFAYPPRVLANLRDNAALAAATMGAGRLIDCTKPAPDDLVCTVEWGDCLIVRESFYFRVRPRPQGGTYVVVELGIHPEAGTAWWQSEIDGDRSRPTGELPTDPLGQITRR
jgi:hypothetical protein